MTNPVLRVDEDAGEQSDANAMGFPTGNPAPVADTGRGGQADRRRGNLSITTADRSHPVRAEHTHSADLATMVEAQALHRRGELGRAEALYRAILGRNRRNAKALHLLGLIALQSRNAEAAIDLITRSIGEDGSDASAHFDLGCALVDTKNPVAALATFERALRLRPDFAAAWNSRGTVLLALGRPADALASFERALGVRPLYKGALHNRGNALMDLGRAAEALASYDGALDLHPDNADSLNARGTALRALGRAQESLATFDRALALAPRHAGALRNRGNALLELERSAEALDCFERALAIDPRDADAHNLRGLALLRLRRPEDAVASFERAVELRPGFAEALGNRGAALLALNRVRDAIESLEQATRAKPDYVNGFVLRSGAMLGLRRLDEALECSARALALDPRHTFALNNRATALWLMKRHDEAAQTVARILEIEPAFDYAPGFLEFARRYCCDWNDYADRVSRLRAAVREGAHACRPFSFFALSDSAAEQRRCAELFVAHDCPPAAQALASREPYGHERIRVVYLSADFHHHATAYLLAELLERHDRTRFEITAISFGPPFEDDMRARLRGAVEHFFDVRELSHRAVAELLRAREIDIAIDLKGHTRDSRPQILALRPAPLQVSFLGYPATTAAPYIDYLIADEEVLPEPQRAHYSEHVVYLPDCYQCNDSRRPIAAHTPSRRELGLPERGFVFCCFNNSYKITPEVFACWMQLLREVPDSVLWLLPANPTATRNLREAARRQHVDPQRLCFCSRLPLPEHLARHRQADLFLDTLPVNAHTTASDALWAGLPVLTCRGESFVARVAASLLRSIGLPELITDSLSDYTARALYLARNPDALAALRARLAHNRLSSPLFDTPRFTRHFEAALLTLYSRHLAGLPPAPFRVRRETEATSPLLDHDGISNAAGGSPRT
jgi:predicted O-linked N-acetylglucosamine transferase (SPINDLY family)